MNGLIVILIFNEESTLPGIIHDFKSRHPEYQCLYIDDGSQDRSTEILQNADVTYLRHPFNLGYKSALQTGMQYALHGHYDFVAFFDADGQHRIEDLETIIAVFEKSKSGLIIGSRFIDQPQNDWTLRSLLNKMFSLLVYFFTGETVTDSTSGLKLIAREFIEIAIHLPSEDMHAELTIALLRSGARFKEVPIKVKGRESGLSMYHFWKAFFYPLKTSLCIIISLLSDKYIQTTKNRLSL